MKLLRNVDRVPSDCSEIDSIDPLTDGRVINEVNPKYFEELRLARREAKSVLLRILLQSDTVTQGDALCELADWLRPHMAHRGYLAYRRKMTTVPSNAIFVLARHCVAYAARGLARAGKLRIEWPNGLHGHALYARLIDPADAENFKENHSHTPAQLKSKRRLRKN